MQSAFVHCLLRRKCEQYLVVPRLALRTFPASQLPFVAGMHCVELSADRYVMYAENDGPTTEASTTPEKISSIGISSWK